MSLLNRVAERTPEILQEASESANELIIDPSPDIIAPANSMVYSMGFNAIVLYGVVAILAGITIWQTIKLYKPKLLTRF